MDDSKEYAIPDDVSNLFAEANAMEGLRDCYVKRPFGYKKAKKCAIASEIVTREAWKMVYNLYPELRNKSISHNHGIVKISK